MSDTNLSLSEREGVFAHLHKCPADGLEFITLSWRAERAKEVVIHCPECQAEAWTFDTITLSRRTTFDPPTSGDDGPGVEIFTVAKILRDAAEAG